jgi:hypothetical protein
MADFLASNLRYGHPGKALYKGQKHGWMFQRNCRTRIALFIFDEGHMISGASFVEISPNIVKEEPTVPILQSQTRRVTTSEPTAAPGFEYLQYEARISEAVDNVTSNLGPSGGELLDLGIAAFYGQSAPIIAMAGGKAGELLRVARMVNTQQGWDQIRTRWIEGLSPDTAEVATWSTGNQPIQQVCFSQSHAKPWKYLAVRTSTAIHILQPILHKVEQAFKVHPDASANTYISRLNPNICFSIPLTDSEMHSPSYLSFNPWLLHQLAVIDRAGRWFIWELSNRTSDAAGSRVSRTVDKATIVHSGQLFQPEVDERTAQTAFEDAWGRIFWCRDSDTIIVCTRTKLSICDIPSRTETSITALLDISKSPGWILDLRIHPLHQDQFLIVTTYSIAWFRIAPVHEETNDGTPKHEVESLLTWIHFRSSEDTSLRTSIFANSKG